MSTTENHGPNGCVDDASCWICLGEGPDELGQPLRRDCSCRGKSSGFTHVSCLVEYAEQKTEQWDGGDPNPWNTCPSCHQLYQNELAVDLATEFVIFVERKYPDDRWKQLEALYRKLVALLGMALKPKQKEEAKEIADKMLLMIRRMETSNSSLPPRILQLEALVCHCLGHIALGEGTTESIKTAVVYYEKCRDISKAIGYANGVTLTEHSISFAMAEYEGSSSGHKEKLMEKKQVLYERVTREFGEGSPHSIQVGVSLAIALRQANRVIEAEILLTKIAIISHRVHGPDHRVTKRAESILKRCKVRNESVLKQYQSKGDKLQVLSCKGLSQPRTSTSCPPDVAGVSFL